MATTVITASDAQNFITSQNQRRRAPGISDEIKQAQKPVFVFNIFKREHRVPLGNYGEFFIPACPDGQKFAGPVHYDASSKDGKHFPYIPGLLACEYDQGNENGQLGMLWEKGYDVAKDVVGIGSSSPGIGLYTTDRSWWGVFISDTATPENPVPSEKELADAKAKLTENMRVWMANGRTLAQAGRLNEINANHRAAARFLNQKVDWATEDIPMDNCPVCQEPIKPGTIKHPCGAILDPAGALRHGILTRQQYEEMTGAAQTAPKAAGPVAGQPIRRN